MVEVGCTHGETDMYVKVDRRPERTWQNCMWKVSVKDMLEKRNVIFIPFYVKLIYESAMLCMCVVCPFLFKS